MKLHEAVEMVEKRTMVNPYALTPEEKNAMNRLISFHKRVNDIIFDGDFDNDSQIIDEIMAEMRR